VSTLNGDVKLEFALDGMAGGALVIGNLREISVVLAGGEVHVVVAGAASATAGSEPGVFLHGGGRVFVTSLAVARVGREDELREVVHALGVTNDLIGFAGFDARQVGAGVEPVDHRGHVHGVARVGVRRLRLMAGDAVFHAGSPAGAVGSELIVALVASGRADDVANHCDLGAVRDEAERRIP